MGSGMFGVGMARFVFFAPLVGVHIERQHAACLGFPRLGRCGLRLVSVVPAIRRGLQQLRQLVVLLVLLREVLQVLVCPVDHRRLGVLPLLAAATARQ